MEINQTRINKFLSETGYCSRREADKLLEQGRITINGVIPELGTKVSVEDEIRVDGKLIREKTEKPVYLAFNKPVGIECTTNLEVPDNIVDYINYPKRIFPIGRLDKDFLTLTMPEKTFGAVTLQLGKDAGMWASRMRELRHG